MLPCFGVDALGVNAGQQQVLNKKDWVIDMHPQISFLRLHQIVTTQNMVGQILCPMAQLSTQTICSPVP
jgi:hypothetical protein